MTGEPAAFRLDLELRAPERLPALLRVFAALQRVKEIQFGPDDELPDDWREPEDPYWGSLLDEQAVAHFATAFDFDSEQGRVHQALWELTEPRRRRDPIFELPGPWSFESVIEAIYGHEYLLTELTRTGPHTAVLVYDPQAGPFGGTEALVQLVEGFGQVVCFDSWNDGPPYRPVVGWDFERARRLVAAGRGV